MLCVNCGLREAERVILVEAVPLGSSALHTARRTQAARGRAQPPVSAPPLDALEQEALREPTDVATLRARLMISWDTLPARKAAPCPTCTGRATDSRGRAAGRACPTLTRTSFWRCRYRRCKLSGTPRSRLRMRCFPSGCSRDFRTEPDPNESRAKSRSRRLAHLFTPPPEAMA
jgi:hypothetical protein